MMEAEVIGLAIMILVVGGGFYYGTRGILHGVGSSAKSCGSKLITCPETAKLALVGLAKGEMSNSGYHVVDRLRVGECSQWPNRQECRQGCMEQIEARLAQ
jgi:hypothetical protein